VSALIRKYQQLLNKELPNNNDKLAVFYSSAIIQPLVSITNAVKIAKLSVAIVYNFITLGGY